VDVDAVQTVIAWVGITLPKSNTWRRRLLTRQSRPLN